MPPLQTTYAPQIGVAVAGMIADMRNRTVVSKTLQSPNPMGFGVPVVRGMADEGCLNLGDTGAGGFIGVSVLDPTVRPLNVNEYSPTDTVAVLARGIIWVTVASAVTPGTAAYYTSAGAFTATSTSNTAIPNATFESTAASGGLAKLKLLS